MKNNNGYNNKTTTRRNRSIIFKIKYLHSYFSSRNILLWEWTNKYFFTRKYILESFRVIIDLEKFWVYSCNRILLTWDIAVSVKYYMRIVACSVENWYHYHSENDISNIEDKKKLDIGKKFYAEKKRQDIGYDVKIKNLYSWRNIKMCTIILIRAFFL